MTRTSSSIVSALARHLRDPRDLPLLAFGLRASVLVPSALLTLLLPLAWPALAWPLAAAQVVLYGLLLERFITWFHDVNHHRLFAREHRWADHWFRVGVGAAFGCTPATYFCQHVLMHHRTNNLFADDSTTLPYQRDALPDFLRYAARFWGCQLRLARFLRRRYPRQPRFARSVLLGDFGAFGLVGLLLWLQPVGAMAALVLPLVLTRTILLVGNWAEHAFVDPEAPEDLYRSSTTLLGAANARCFNVGHHIGHHLRPGLHFSELPAWFEAHRDELGRRDALVFTDLNYPDLWWLLMTRQWRRLAEHHVALPGAPPRDPAALIALFKQRLQPVEVARA